MLDDLGYDEFWCGEHHSGGWETIASPETVPCGGGRKHEAHHARHGRGFAAVPPPVQRRPAHRAARSPDAGPRDARRRARARCHRTRARSASHPSVQRDRMDEALGVIIRLLNEDKPFSYKGEWFELVDAQLQIKPLQPKIPMVAASTLSPAGMKAAGKYGIGVISIASASEEGLAALPTQWGFGETYAAEYGNTMDRSNVADQRQLAHRADARAGDRRGGRRPTAVAQRVQRRHPRPPEHAADDRRRARWRGRMAESGRGNDRHAGGRRGGHRSPAEGVRRVRHARRLRARLGAT